MMTYNKLIRGYSHTLLLFLLIFPLLSRSQQVYHFTGGLAVNPGARYGREALYSDILAYQLYTNSLVKPSAGGLFNKSAQGAELKWAAVAADTTRRFRGRENGYIYLTYQSEKEQSAILNILGNSAVYVNSVPHTGDPYSSGWMNIPVPLKQGLNEFYVRGQSISARLVFPLKPVLLDTGDPTVPFIVEGRPNADLKGAIVLINTSNKELKGLEISSEIGGRKAVTQVPAVPALSTRKVIFSFNGDGARRGPNDCTISLNQSGKLIDSKVIKIESVSASDKYMNTFVSGIDGSLQYYAVAQKPGLETENAALFLSVHGAGVEAIGQARAYQAKDWGTLVAATNRRPRGFNWEDWGRLDALEVLALARERFKPDPRRIYLTGHSMGGHGTWFLGATYPDKWAAIAPCAGYPTLKGYGSADGLIPDTSKSAMGQVLLRASNQSDVPKLAFNYKPLGIYVLHGDADRTVSVNYARQMKTQLSGFHSDFSYYEYPGGSHWYGSESVDWKPMFDYFKWHIIPVDSAVNVIDFTTASPGISSSYRWASIHQQISPLQYSRVRLNRNQKSRTITGTTENIRLLRLELSGFGNNTPVSITLDNGNNIQYTTKSAQDNLFLVKNDTDWGISSDPGPAAKGPHRYGTFKEAFNKNMVFVYGTSGIPEENEWSINKARFDAETWYYRGNGSVDIVSDKEYSPAKYAGRNVILFGNSSTNAAWSKLLNDCPVKVSRGTVSAGGQNWTGDDLGAYFIWPLKGTESNSVAVISGTGLKGMKAVNANQYFAGGSGFPDIMIYRLSMIQSGVSEVELAGFFDNDWKLDGRDVVRK